MHLRRYLLLQSVEARVRGQDGLQVALRTKQSEIAGTALSTALPGYARLVAAGYQCTEDVIGARAEELTRIAGLNRREADAVIAAVGS
jgi:hypothetical protein